MRSLEGETASVRTVKVWFIISNFITVKSSQSRPISCACCHVHNIPALTVWHQHHMHIDWPSQTSSPLWRYIYTQLARQACPEGGAMFVSEENPKACVWMDACFYFKWSPESFHLISSLIISVSINHLVHKCQNILNILPILFVCCF